jgi:hypothetical protein
MDLNALERSTPPIDIEWQKKDENRFGCIRGPITYSQRTWSNCPILPLRAVTLVIPTIITEVPPEAHFCHLGSDANSGYDKFAILEHFLKVSIIKA